MQWSVLLLILMGHSSIFVCHLYEYHFIDEKMKWDEARTYCRENHSDLATVHTMTGMERLKNSVRKHKDWAWIGLRCDPGQDNRTWHWSLPGVEYNETNTSWAPSEPNDNGQTCENCVSIRKEGWDNLYCTKERRFICYNETSNKYHPIKKKKKWTEAQRYCRQHHTDLASGFHQLNSDQFKLEDGEHYWIGLFRDSWRWSDGSNSSFRDWKLEPFPDEDKECAKLDKDGKWESDSCDESFPFFCYEDKTILIKQSKTWVEALSYCRENHNDLVSITNLDEQRGVQDKAKNASTPFVWLGLRYTCTLEFWFWVSDEAVNYENWASPGKDDCDMSGAMERGGEHKWFRHTDETKYNFICSEY